jgi:hypothetical protein
VLAAAAAAAAARAACSSGAAAVPAMGAVSTAAIRESASSTCV